MRLFVHLRPPLVASAMLLLVVTAAPSSAQIFKKIADRAKEGVERKAEQKISQKIDDATSKLVNRSFDKVFGDDGSGSGGSKKGGGSRLFSLLPNAPTEARYDFNAVVTYEIESMPKGKPTGEMLEMTMQFNPAKSYAGARLVQKDKPAEGAFNMIFDVPNESMVMLFESDTGKFSMAYGWKDARRYAETQQPSSASGGTVATTQVRQDARPLQYTKLGARRIAGYNAEGYRAEDAEGLVDVWIAKDASLNYGRLVGATSSMKGMRGAMPDSYPVGMLMASESTDKKTGDKTRMTVTSVNPKANVQIDMSKYPKIGASK